MVSFIVRMLVPLIVMLVAAALLSGLLASRLSRRIVKPLNELDLDHPLENDTYEEIAPLLGRIEHQHREIENQMAQLQQKQDEFSAVTSSMSEGLALLNAGGVVLSINQSAARLLGTDQSAVGRDILTVNRSLTVQDLLLKAQSGEHAEATLPDGDSEYQLVASPRPVRRAGVRRGAADLRHHREEPRRAAAPGVLGQRLPRAQDAAPLHLRLRRDHPQRPRQGSRPAQFIDQIYSEAQRPHHPGGRHHPPVQPGRGRGGRAPGAGGPAGLRPGGDGPAVGLRPAAAGDAPLQRRPGRHPGHSAAPGRDRLQPLRQRHQVQRPPAAAST